MTAFTDLSNQRFGRVLVHARLENKGKHVMWQCACDCGASLTVSSTHLRSGHTQSCGCLRNEATAARNVESAMHGMWGTPEWNSWAGMNGRCHTPTDRKYALYGGRGITVCDEWRASFQSFYDHIGPRPSDDYTVDRIDSNKGYEPGNVRWATAETQNNNRRSNVVIVIGGVRKTAAQVSREFGITYRAAIYRITHGKPLT